MDDWDEEAELVRIAEFNTLLRTFATGSRIEPYRDGPGYALYEWIKTPPGAYEDISVYENLDELEAQVHRIVERVQAARFNSSSSV